MEDYSTWETERLELKLRDISSKRDQLLDEAKWIANILDKRVLKQSAQNSPKNQRLSPSGIETDETLGRF